MIKRILVFGLVFAGLLSVAGAEVLIVADEFPAMETLAGNLKKEENLDSKLVWQTNLPPNLSSYQAVIVYIHKELKPSAEEAFIHYAEGGGKLVVLHHSISSGKRKNEHWFKFLGVELPEGEVKDGGYKWIEGISWQLVELNTNHFIMTNQVVYPETIPFEGTNLSGFTLPESEVYLNHIHTEPHILLMGLKYTDAKTGVTYMQEHSGWIKPAGKGWVVYLMPGHTKHDFENAAYGRIVVNAVIYQP